MTAAVDVARAIDVAKSILSMIYYQPCDCEKCILARAVIAMAEERDLLEHAMRRWKRYGFDGTLIDALAKLDSIRRSAEGRKRCHGEYRRRRIR